MASSIRVTNNVQYLFIDGACLDSYIRKLSNCFNNEVMINIDYSMLAVNFQKVFYYDCLPAQKKNESEKDYEIRRQSKLNLFNHLNSLDRFHVYEGTARFRDKQRGQEQKQVDIMMTVDMLRHSFRRNMEQATLLTGDLDFKPLIDALVQDGMYISLWYPKGETNYELVDAADSRLPITIYQVLAWCSPASQIKFKIPETRTLNSSKLEPSWQNFEAVQTDAYNADFYRNASHYCALIPLNNEFSMYIHDNLEQLKLFVDHIHSPNIVRKNFTK
jgi:uncharacterized LabA/DUF88 family protein